jgi:hypothetical protein
MSGKNKRKMKEIDNDEMVEKKRQDRERKERRKKGQIRPKW